MKRYSPNYLVAFLLLIVGLLSCKREVSSVTAPPDEKDTVATKYAVLKGRVITIGSYSTSTKPRVGLDSARVEVSSSPFSPYHDSMYVTYTDALGWFTLVAPEGTHTIRYSREGYGEMKKYQVKVYGKVYNSDTLGTTILDTLDLGEQGLPEIPAEKLTLLSSTRQTDGSGRLFFQTKWSLMPYDTNERRYRVMVSVYKQNPEVDALQVPGQYIGMGTVTNGEYLLNLNETTLRSFNSDLGDTAYVKLQIANVPLPARDVLGNYYDPFTNRMYFTACGKPSQLLVFDLKH